jgi:uncharacterized membrane protein
MIKKMGGELDITDIAPHWLCLTYFSWKLLHIGWYDLIGSIELNQVFGSQNG